MRSIYVVKYMFAYSLNLQVAYDLEVACHKIQPQIEKEVLPRVAA